MDMSLAAPLSSTLPPLYAAWMDQVLAGPIPEETQATCANCAMCAKAGDPPTSSTLFFHPQVKCCTYMPRLPNFLVGRLLADDDPDFAQGRMTVEERLHKGVAVTPLGLGRDAVYALLYQQRASTAFGRSRALRCPHYIEEGGRCGVWKHRESTCATWFCKHVRGAVGMQFWQDLKQLLHAVEESLARWCVHELDVGIEALQLLFPATQQPGALPVLDQNELDGVSDPVRYRAMWGHWAGREREFYQASALLVNALTWNDVCAICGPELQIFVRLTQEAYRQLTSDTIPPILQVRPFKTLQMAPEASQVWSYSSYDPLKLPKVILDVLPYFDGRSSTEEVQQSITAEKGITLSEALIRKLVDFDILGPTT